MGSMAVDSVQGLADSHHPLTPKIVILSAPEIAIKERDNPDVLECHRVEDDPQRTVEEHQRLLEEPSFIQGVSNMVHGAQQMTKEDLFQKWKPLFDKYDLDGKGVISLEAFQVILYKDGLKDLLLPHKLEKLESTIEENRGSVISYKEFINILSDKRSLSFAMAIRPKVAIEYCVNIGSQTPIIKTVPVHQRILNSIADEFLTDQSSRAKFVNSFSWCPPSMLLLLLSFLQIAFYIINFTKEFQSNRSNHTHNLTVKEMLFGGPLSNSSVWIYSPVNQLQFWRFGTYPLLHAGIEHLIFNISIQILIGVPFEVIHGTRRIGTFYAACITVGSMGTSLLDSSAYLVGASCANYAFLTAHFSNVLLHYPTAKIRYVKSGILITLTFLDFSIAVYRRYAGFLPVISYVGHILGIFLGPTLGLFLIRNYNKPLHEKLGMWLAVTLYIAFVIIVVALNIVRSLKTITVT